MKLTLIPLVVLAAAFSAKAETISPFNDSINLGTGVWVYGAQHTSGELHDGDGFAIFDFAGFSGFGAIPANWTAATQFFGSPYGAAIFGVDAPGVHNLVFTYHGPSFETGVGPPFDLGDFTANTSLDNQVLDDWKSRDHLVGNPGVIDGGVASEHGDLIYVPAGGPRGVPDGGSMVALFGFALLGIEVLRRKLGAGAAVAGLMAVTGPASAVIIDNPLTLQTQFVAGILNGQPGASNATIEEGYAQTILNLPLGGTSGVAPNTFQANTVFDYSGTITFNGGQSTAGIEAGGDDFINIPAGWGGALAKYDGPNAGYVLFLFGGTASTIPEYPWDLWTTNQSQYQISHYTLFRGTGGLTPTPQSVPEGGVGLGLFSLFLAGMGLVRKKLKV